MRRLSTSDLQDIEDTFYNALKDYKSNGNDYKFAKKVSRIKAVLDDRCYSCSSEYARIVERIKKKRDVKRISKEKVY